MREKTDTSITSAGPPPAVPSPTTSVQSGLKKIPTWAGGSALVGSSSAISYSIYAIAQENPYIAVVIIAGFLAFGALAAGIRFIYRDLIRDRDKFIQTLTEHIKELHEENLALRAQLRMETGEEGKEHV